MVTYFECPHCGGKLSMIHDDPYDPDHRIFIFKPSDIAYNQFTPDYDYKEFEKEKEDIMIRITNNNCGFGETVIEIRGHGEMDHAATYLSGRSQNKHYDKPYLGDFSIASEYLRNNLPAAPAIECKFCMGGGCVPEYERLTVELLS